MKIYVVVCDYMDSGDDRSFSTVIKVTNSLDVAMESIASDATDSIRDFVQVSDVRKAIEQDESFECSRNYTANAKELYEYIIQEWEV